LILAAWSDIKTADNLNLHVIFFSFKGKIPQSPVGNCSELAKILIDVQTDIGLPSAKKNT